MEYRKKPVVVEAVKFLGFSGKEGIFSGRPKWLLKAIYESCEDCFRPEVSD